MIGISSKKTWAATLATGLAGVLGLVMTTASAPADQAKRAPATITMEFDGMSAPRFEGPSQIAAGTNLRIQNNSDPEVIGPHTFSITKARFIPKSNQEMKACEKGELKICKRVFKAHKVDFQNRTVGKQLVTRGRNGWDKSFSEDKNGDSWFALDQDEEVTQTTSAPVGKTLHYFCAIHPEMQGKIKVVAP